MMQLSEYGAHQLCNHEGFRDYVYDDKSGKPWEKSPKLGFPTIGYGHMIKRDAKGNLLEKFPPKITRQEGEVLFKKDCEPRVKRLNELIKVPVNQNQFDALFSIMYNIGDHALAASTLLHKLNQGDYKGAADHFLDWRYDSHHDPVLLPRRKEEQALFMRPV